MSETSVPSVAAAVINHNGAAYLKACVESLLAQDHPPAEVVVLDNRSTDGSVTLIRETFPELCLIEVPDNLGYAAAANLAIRETDSRYLLLVNPDVVLTPSFLRELMHAAERHPDVGSLTGKLLRFPEAAGVSVIDSTGHIMFRNRWASNRGTGEDDVGQYEEPAEIFGVSGAAALYRREMLEDIRVGGEVFPESYFIYFEDVDVDWRARLRGWRAHYVPTAVAYHERRVRRRGRGCDPVALRCSLRNRYLTLVRNETAGNLLRDALAILPMELLRLVEALVAAPHALVGYVDVLRFLPGTLRQRREIQRRATAPREVIRRWFVRYPYGERMLRCLGWRPAR